MTSLRENLHPPRREIAADELERLRAYLDGQSRIRLAAFASHEHHGPGGAVDYDEHLLLGVADADYEGEHVRALDRGIEREIVGVHAWFDLFALSDADAVRGLAEVLWERNESPAGELDPLEFRLTWEPLDVSEAAVAAVAEHVRAIGGVRRVEAGRERLWKNGREVAAEVCFYVDFAIRRPNDFELLEDALRDAGAVPATSWQLSAGLPGDGRVRTAVLYAR